ncbi:hypothetical protein YH66_15070 [[Brevibacterium] flavum]|uniref:Uncharacterized protein n=1 Tax=[Brevibacterium] flavum TaxID=92706 RepID=A0A0F6WRP0_9CORY|nr:MULTISPECIES: hypothetical protein [Corynebacterium]ANR63851.1 hypothetical protein C628_14855 [[Brevibacterium] flavum ZL-1]AJE68554.1 hypothetical protein SB89_14065 [Corynebacterium glutamicum]AKF28751.1 hypothetical protein YH66_15070 [[Brevibacterium] flavum]ANE09604.1 hypothetical protein A3654_15280 [Corynebacterium glutamicum]ANR66859.1 hypothetical protein C627_14720 [Corynebacterium glutamicum ZL-6]
MSSTKIVRGIAKIVLELFFENAKELLWRILGHVHAHGVERLGTISVLARFPLMQANAVYVVSMVTIKETAHTDRAMRIVEDFHDATQNL